MIIDMIWHDEPEEEEDTIITFEEFFIRNNGGLGMELLVIHSYSTKMRSFQKGSPNSIVTMYMELLTVMRLLVIC